MVMVTGQHNVLIEVKPLVRERTQMWARLAGQAVSFEDINLVQAAFLALWWEADAAKSFESVARHASDGKMHLAVQWLGYVIDELDVALQTWQRVLELLEALSANATSARRLSRCVRDTSVHLDEVVQCMAVLRAQMEVFSEMYGASLPERLFQATPVVSNGVNVDI